MLPKKHTKFNFDDKLCSQGKLFNPKITRSQKNQVQLEYTKENLRQKAGLSTSIAQFLKLQESARSSKKLKRSGKGSCFSRMVCGTISGHAPKPYRGYLVNQLLLQIVSPEGTSAHSII